jgi:hypothetical protein
MTSTRTVRRIAASAVLSSIAFAGLTGLAAAETPAFEPGVEIAFPEPTIPLPEPDPAPVPDLPLADACGLLEQGCQQPDPDPEPPVGPDDLADPCGLLPEGCEQPDDEIDDFTAEPADPDDPVDPVDPPEPKEPGEDPKQEPDLPVSLPRTGAAFAGLLGIGTALVGAGAIAKRAARR